MEIIGELGEQPVDKKEVLSSLRFESIGGGILEGALIVVDAADIAPVPWYVHVGVVGICSLMIGSNLLSLRDMHRNSTDYLVNTEQAD